MKTSLVTGLGPVVWVRTALADRLRLRPRSRLGQKLTAGLAGLIERERELSVLAKEGEARFLAMGAGLQSQADLSGRLVEQGERLVRLTNGGESDEDAVHAAVTLSQKTLGFIDECGGQAGELIARLDRYHEQSGLLLKEEQQVEQILAPLRIIQILFRVESVSLPADMQAGFDALSSQIPRFEAEVRETFIAHADALAQARRRIAATILRLRERREQQIRAMDAGRERIARSLGALERESAHGRERNGRLAHIIREISGSSQGLVVNIQYQDITRQKMEHVGVALKEIQARAGVDGHSVKPADLGFLLGTCRVEAMQSRTVARELAAALDGIAAGAREIRGKLDQIEAECWPRAEFKTVVGAVQERVANLQVIMKEVGELVMLSLGTVEEAITVIDSFGGVAANVANAAREMAESMRLIALNAQVLAAQAGEQGAGLLVLAERTYAISTEIKNITDRIGHEFNQSATQLESVVQQCEALKRHAHECRRELETRSQPATQRLDAYRDETVKILETIGETLGKIHEHTEALSASAEAKGAFCDPLERLHDDLAAIAVLCEGSRHSQKGDAAGLGEMECRYTMDTERQVHAAALAGEKAPPSVLAAHETASGKGGENKNETEPFGGNVELF